MILPQISCFIGKTHERTHELVRRHIHLSPLYNGSITGVSARYCPSLEDKVMKFPQREFHQIILEPEGLETEEIYASGTGNSLPYEIQLQLVHSIPGLEAAEIMRPAYAIEYDFVQPTQLPPPSKRSWFMGSIWLGRSMALRVMRKPLLKGCGQGSTLPYGLKGSRRSSWTVRKPIWPS